METRFVTVLSDRGDIVYAIEPEKVVNNIRLNFALRRTELALRNPTIVANGGKGSGNFKHKGRKGLVGGSTKDTTIDDPFDAKDYLTREDFFNEWHSKTHLKATSEQRDAEYWYTDGKYSQVNRLLRHNQKPPEYDEEDVNDTIENLRSLIGSDEAPENFIVFRGTPLHTPSKDDIETDKTIDFLSTAEAKAKRREEHLALFSNLDRKIADPSFDLEFSDKGFFSTSVSDSVANGFGRQSNANSMLFTVRVPKGTRCSAVFNSEQEGEYEVLFPDSARFKVLSAKKEKNGWLDSKTTEREPAYNWFVELEAIP